MWPLTQLHLTQLRANSNWQIFWSGNYWPYSGARGMLVWDKEQPWENFSQVEYQWTNLDPFCGAVPRGATRGTPGKAHPTQKPLSLMRWCVAMVDALTVLDPYMGSGNNWRRRRADGAQHSSASSERDEILRHRRKKD